MHTEQLGLFASVVAPPESQVRTHIRQLTEGGLVNRATRVFEVELLRCLHKARGDTRNETVQSFVEFGNQVLGDGATPVFMRCIEAISSEAGSPP